MTIVDLSRLGLKRVPESLRESLALKKLVLDDNQLVALPEWLGDFAHLEELHVDQNKFNHPAQGSPKTEPAHHT